MWLTFLLGAVGPEVGLSPESDLIRFAGILAGPMGIEVDVKIRNNNDHQRDHTTGPVTGKS
jgi:hypothetical protein